MRTSRSSWLTFHFRWALKAQRTSVTCPDLQGIRGWTEAEETSPSSQLVHSFHFAILLAFRSSSGKRSVWKGCDWKLLQWRVCTGKCERLFHQALGDIYIYIYICLKLFLKLHLGQISSYSFSETWENCDPRARIADWYNKNKLLKDLDNIHSYLIVFGVYPRGFALDSRENSSTPIKHSFLPLTDKRPGLDELWG